MAVAFLLTGLALVGIVAGTVLGQSKMLSAHLGAAGGGLLFGICLFWLMPEIAESAGWLQTVSVAFAVWAFLLWLDRYLLHGGHSPRRGVLAPLLIATAVHSFLDGWSIRAVSQQELANVAVPLGLALHKVPEGLALGWIMRRSTPAIRAIALGSLAEAATLAGAYVEPAAESSGVAAFGARWSVLALAVVAGSFLFLGFHSVVAERKKAGVVPVFFAAVAIAGIAAVVHF